MTEDITIERALIEALLGTKPCVREDVPGYWWVRMPPSQRFPEIAWSEPGFGKYLRFGPWRMYTQYDGTVICGFDNIIAELRAPAFRERMNLPPLDDSE